MTSLTEQIERTVFHDAELGRCLTEGDSVKLYFRDIALEWGKEEYYSALVTLSGVREIRRFDEPVAQLTLEGDGSDVLQFRKGEGRALLLIEWHHFQQRVHERAHVFAKYEIDYTAYSITVEKQNGLSV